MRSTLCPPLSRLTNAALVLMFLSDMYRPETSIEEAVAGASKSHSLLKARTDLGTANFSMQPQ